ncbi:hypothetical protein C8F04DRAFT_1034219 [Mycena alexandri]|uniref:C2H2-type domain-containing protein n=1 Tax=Mycena alexandri TaxID=1745969 RepID=A0AAD6T587_9AGAR|nr:hypothetical protein C8F04DRAFT_1034219 [Mycena alexandri]
MAILLSGGNLQHEEDSYGDSAPPRAFNNLRMPVSYALMNPDVCAPPLEDDPDALEEGLLSREKKHGCTMCHKRFDRPSTLKKHLLVHTGEKAFQCTICERRFGVMSNLNRHIRRCSLREVHTHGASGASAPALSSLDEKDSPPIVPGKRGRTPPLPSSVDSPKAPAAPRKRRRRPPSPSRWIPASLRSFNILPPELTPAADIPLAPVRPTYLCPNTGRVPGPQWEEERDSFDENVGRAPYHPSEWDKTCRLPGPAVKFGGGIGGNYIGESDFGYDLYRSRSAIRVG